MKNNIKRISIVLLLCFGISACEDVFDNKLIKNNPNAVTEISVPLGTGLAGTLIGVSKMHEDTDTRIAYMWSGQMTGSNRQHLALSQYIVSAGTFSWADYYGTLGNSRVVQAKADALKDTWHKGVAQVAEALIMAKVTSLWGDAPYTEAADILKFPKPKYDPQATLYTLILAKLDEAIANLSAPTGLNPGANDIIYGGDVRKWIRAAYTLKARLYLHLGDYANAIANANQGINSTSGDALIPHGPNQDIDQNLNYSFFVNTRAGDTNFSSPAVLPGLMTPNRNSKTDDTALYNHFFQFGLITDGVLDANVNDDGFFAQDASQPILTFYENQLILAESYARQNSTINAVRELNKVRQGLATGYINGREISEDNQDLGLKYDNYVDSDFATQNALIYEIVLTKYMVSLSQYESFNDVRRLAKATPVVKLPVTPIVATRTNDIPGRYVYPAGEVNTNENIATITDQFEKLAIFK